MFDDARERITGFIDVCNTIRLCSSLFYLTLNDLLNDKITEKLEARNTKLQSANNLL